MSNNVIVATVKTREVVTAVVYRGVPGRNGTNGSGAIDQRIIAIDEVMSNGYAGTAPIAVAGMTSANDYIVLANWHDDCGKNGNIRIVRTATDFVLKHTGTTMALIGYMVVRKVLP